MHVEIEGESKRVPRGRILKALDFYAKILLGKRMAKNIYLTLSIESMGKDRNYALCEWDHDNLRPRDFTITIDKNLGEKDFLRALAHEMVHLKQYARGELRELYKPKKVVWKGVDHDVDSPDHDYWFAPWEIEAYGMEHGLYYKFLDHETGN
jgi:hypothetical protein